MEVPAVSAKPRQPAGRGLVDASLNGGDAILFERVSQEPGLDTGRPRFPLLEKLLEHCHHNDGTDPRAHGVLEALVIGLCLVLAAEARKDRPASDVDGGAGGLAVTDAGQNAGEGYPDVGTLLLLHLLDGVSPDDVSDFVTK